MSTYRASSPAAAHMLNTLNAAHMNMVRASRRVEGQTEAAREAPALVNIDPQHFTDFLSAVASVNGIIEASRGMDITTEQIHLACSGVKGFFSA